ncbi:MAG: InlB B-repeat-containing protein, partial [Kiritimatiellae bacterium]|nr:InlB B-repeat-containing protein [Kiritimatiellia bacterium]
MQNSKIYWRDFASVGYTVTFHFKFGINVRSPYLPGMASRAESDLPSGNGTVSGMGYVEFYETWSPDAVIFQSTLDLNAGYAVAVAPLINEPLYFYPVLKGNDPSRQRSRVVAYRKSDGAAIVNRLPDSVAQVTLSVGDEAAYSDAYRILDLFETKLFVEIHCAPCVVGVAYTVDGGTAQTVAAAEYTTIGPLPFGSTVSYWGTQDASGSSGRFELNASPENPATFVVGEEHIGIERILQPVSPEEPFSVCPTSERQFEVTFDNFFRMHPVLASQLEVTGGRVVRLYDDYSYRTTRVSEYGANTFWSGFVLFSAGAGTASVTTAPSIMGWLIFRACRPGDLSLSFRVAAVALDGSSSPGYSSKANMLYSDESPFAENAPFLLRSMFDRVDADSVFEHNLEHVSVAVRFYDYDGDAIESATWLEDSETTVQGEQSFGFADVGASRLSVRVPSGAATMRMTFSVSPGYAALFGSVRLAPAMYDGDESLSVSYSAIENYQFPEAPHINLRSITDGYKFSDYFKFPTPTRPGYEFQRWISCDFGANAREFASSSPIPMRDLSLISVWRGMEIDTLFNTEGGLIYKEENGEKVINPSAFFGKVRIGETFGTLPTPERAGYIFDGWYPATEGGTRLLADSFVPFQTDTTLQLYAHWTPDPDYAPPRSTKIIYHFLTDEPDATETVTGRLGGQAALHPPTPTVAKPGHAFNGWSAVPPGDRMVFGYNPNFFVNYAA